MIRMKIAFVLRLVDDFSGMDIRKTKFVFSIGGRVVHPIEKEEGLFVFLEPQEAETRVWREGIDYYPCSALIQKKLLDPAEPIADIRLYGKVGKNLPYSYGVLSGKVGEDISLPTEVYAKRSKPTGLILKEYRNVAGEWLILQGYTQENLLGKPYILEDSKEVVAFVLVERRGINEYRAEFLGDPPEKLEPGTPLERIYRSLTDKNGNYAIPVECGEEELIQNVMVFHHRLSPKGRGG